MRSNIFTTFESYLNIDNTKIKKTILERVPFFNQYNIFDDKYGFSCQLFSEHTNVNMLQGDDIIKFPKIYISSEFNYMSRDIHNNRFHSLYLKNRVIGKPDNISDLEYKVLIVMLNSLSDKLSYRDEIMVGNNGDLSDKQIDDIIDILNKKLFEFENFTEEKNIRIF